MAGDYSDLYYPTWWEFVGQIVFLCLLYTPSFALVYMNRRMVATCIRRAHPNYDFKNKCLNLEP